MDYTVLIVAATALSAVLWGLDRWVWAPERLLTSGGEARRPTWLEWTAGLFPVLLAVLLIRSFLYEPFRIPSGSMEPTLLPGDLILVKKYAYGLRMPLSGARLAGSRTPARGDVIVFHYPLNPRLSYIKRVVGLPGDEVVYLDKRLVINGERQKQVVPKEKSSGRLRLAEREETLGGVRHRIYLNPKVPPEVKPAEGISPADTCRYSRRGVVCRVPAGQYFVMGDNRDGSEDSRYWGYVPEKNVIGKAVLIAANFSDMKRSGRIR